MKNNPHHFYPVMHNPYPVQASRYPVQSVDPFYPRAILSAGLFGTLVGGTTAFALNLHRVKEKQITMSHAITDSLAKGAVAGVATSAAAVVVSSMNSRGLAPFVILIATATGVGYLLTSIGRPKPEVPAEAGQTKT